MKRFLVTVLFVTHSVVALSQSSEVNSEKTFLNIDHYRHLSEYVFEQGDLNRFDSESGSFLVTDIGNLINPFRGNEEYLQFHNLQLNSERAYFDKNGDLHHIILDKQGRKLLPAVVEILDARFKSHTYYDGAYIWETRFIDIWAGINEEGNTYVVSRRKQ